MKSTVIGWDSRWGTPMEVTAAGDSSTGTMRPFGLDCTGFIDWVLRNAGLPSDGNWYIGVNLTEVSRSEALPGDIALNADASHVGIIVGRDENGNLLVCHCSSGQDNVVVTEFGKSNFVIIGSVGLSNILDDKLIGRKPVERSQGEVVGAAVMDSDLPGEVTKRVETVTGVKALLVLPVAALLSSRGFKKSMQVPPAVRKAIGERKAVIRLDALYPDAAAGDYLRIHLDPLIWAGHLLVGFGLAGFGLAGGFLVCLWEHPKFAHFPEQALRAESAAPLLQPVPQLHHAQRRIPEAQVSQTQRLAGCEEAAEDRGLDTLNH